jgi:hypothetical protein
MAKDAAGKPERGKIDLANKDEAKYWARQLGVTPRELAKLVAKAGDSAAGVRKELADRARAKTPIEPNAPISAAKRPR